METQLAISSPAFADGENIPQRYTAAGANIHPPLVISGVSSQAKSLVLIVDDPDAATDPMGSGATYTHWVVFNISPTTTEIPEGSMPAGAIRGTNSAGVNTYVGPSPPTGVHRYFFRLYELSGMLQLSAAATKEDVQLVMSSLVLGKAELVGRYGRQM